MGFLGSRASPVPHGLPQCSVLGTFSTPYTRLNMVLFLLLILCWINCTLMMSSLPALLGTQRCSYRSSNDLGHRLAGCDQDNFAPLSAPWNKGRCSLTPSTVLPPHGRVVPSRWAPLFVKRASIGSAMAPNG